MTSGASECCRGHERHATVVVSVDLFGQRSHDFALFPAHRRQHFDLEVFDYPRYRDAGGFCPGQDGSHDGILTQGIWEPWETRLVVEILATHAPSLVLDFGANVGWYTILAATMGHRVTAFEAEPEVCDLCRRNAARNGVDGQVEIRHGWVGCDTPRLRGDEDVLFLKSDVEGNERHVVAACADLFVARRVHYAMLEVSPCFCAGYDEILAQIMAWGYDAFAVPDKGCSYLRAFSDDPLAVLDRTRILDPRVFVSSIQQVNVLLVRR